MWDRNFSNHFFDISRLRGIEFDGSVETLRLVLMDMGFKYRTRNRRRYLMELPNIVKQRVAFVKEFMRLKHEGKYAFKYLDETWIFRHGSFSGSEWIIDGDKNTYSTAHTNNGQRYIILHCGGKGIVLSIGLLLFPYPYPLVKIPMHDSVLTTRWMGAWCSSPLQI